MIAAVFPLKFGWSIKSSLTLCLLLLSGCSVSVDGINPEKPLLHEPVQCPVVDGEFLRQGTIISKPVGRSLYDADNLASLINDYFLFDERTGDAIDISTLGIKTPLILKVDEEGVNVTFALDNGRLLKNFIISYYCENGRLVIKHRYTYPMYETTVGVFNMAVLRKDNNSLLVTLYQERTYTGGIFFTTSKTQSWQGQYRFYLADKK
ncbi:hypothetical protein SOASR031_31670 [Leminorella grimontii]|nr:hypothetical protein SOASR031_31670 [Leminorella grimontii]